MRNLSNTMLRITKSVARKIYNEGGNVFFVPCYCNPDNNVWGLGIWQNKYLDGQYDNFDTLVNAYEGYNCNGQTGEYAAYYIRRN